MQVLLVRDPFLSRSWSVLVSKRDGHIGFYFKGYGQTGPYADNAGYDVIIEAEAGLMHMYDWTPVRRYAITQIAMTEPGSPTDRPRKLA